MENQFVRRELQINIHPNDYKHFELILRHEVKVWGGIVDQIRLTLDLHNSASGRYRSESFAENLKKMRDIIYRVSQDFNSIIVDDVEDSLETRKAVAKHFFNKEIIPIKAWDGGPFYSYLYGLWKSRAETLIHIDSDMMFGGSSEQWINEAESILENDETVVFVSPLSGPPHPDGILFGHALQSSKEIKKYKLTNSYEFHSVSTRIFVMKPKLFAERVGYLDWQTPSLAMRLKSLILGNPPDSREFEVVLSKTLQNRNLKRVDLLGEMPGLWSLHPPYRSDRFYSDLHRILQRVEKGQIPSSQLGRYDICDDLCDWSDARMKNTKIQRLKKQFLRAVNRHFHVG